MKNSSRFFNNRECEYYPCHKNMAAADINCLFCYCPLFTYDCARYGGTPQQAGSWKDCSSCTWNHVPENYDKIVAALING